MTLKKPPLRYDIFHPPWTYSSLWHLTWHVGKRDTEGAEEFAPCFAEDVPAMCEDRLM